MRIDLNADVGEGGAFDQSLMCFISSANISCGAHAGNRDTINAAIQSALANHVAIGAHPGYPDPQNFGRTNRQLGARELRSQMHSQLTFLQQLVSAEGAVLEHVKPHGALYNQAAVDFSLASDLVAILQEFDDSLTIVALAGSQLLKAAQQAGAKTRAEAFADRIYAADGSLVPRSAAGAVIHDPALAIKQSLQLIQDKTVTAVDGTKISVIAESLCLHGDNPEALDFARQLRQAFTKAGITVGTTI